MKSLHPQMPRHLINGSYIELISFIFLLESSFICIASFTISIAVYTVHLNRVDDKAKFYTSGWGKPILTYHMIDQLSRISKFNDKKGKGQYMSVLSITFLDLICLEMMF